MSVISLRETSGTVGGRVRDGGHTFTRTFIAICNNQTDTAMTVLGNPGLPVLGDSFFVAGNTGDRDRDILVDSVTATRRERAPRVWDISVEYRRRSSDGLDLSGAFREYQKPISKTPSGKEIVNAAGDPFLNVEMDDSRTLLTFVRTERELKYGTLLEYNNSLNADIVTLEGFPFRPGTLRMSIGFTRIYDQPSLEYHWRKTYEIQHRERVVANIVYGPRDTRTEEVSGWQLLLRNEGLSEYQRGDRSGRQQEFIPDPDGPVHDEQPKVALIDPVTGAPYTDPQPLTSEGRMIRKGTKDEEEIGYLFFEVYHERKWSPLKLFTEAME